MAKTHPHSTSVQVLQESDAIQHIGDMKKRYILNKQHTRVYISIFVEYVILNVRKYYIPVVPHKAVAEVSKIGNL